MPKTKSRQLKLSTHPYSQTPNVVIEPRVTSVNANRIILELPDETTALAAKTLLHNKPLWVNYDTRIKEQLTADITHQDSTVVLDFYSLTDLVTIKQHFDVIFAQTFPPNWAWSYRLRAGCRDN